MLSVRQVASGNEEFQSLPSKTFSTWESSLQVGLNSNIFNYLVSILYLSLFRLACPNKHVLINLQTLVRVEFVKYRQAIIIKIVRRTKHVSACIKTLPGLSFQIRRVQRHKMKQRIIHRFAYRCHFSAHFFTIVLIHRIYLGKTLKFSVGDCQLLAVFAVDSVPPSMSDEGDEPCLVTLWTAFRYNWGWR